MCCRNVLIACVAVLGSLTPGAAWAQASLGVSGGIAQSSWKGPYQQGGESGMWMSAWGETALRPHRSVRAELGYGGASADFGTLGSIFSEQTTLIVSTVHLALVGRMYSRPVTSPGRAFLDLGAGIWRRAGCDVDMAGGPGFFGGSTESCDGWTVSDPFVGCPECEADAPLRARAGGALILVGAGLKAGRFAMGLRYMQPLGALVETDDGDLHVRQLLVAIEWAFSR